MPVNSVVLGEINYFGEIATAIREVYQDCWKFVIVTKHNRFILMEY